MEEGQWEDHDCSTYSKSTETQQLTAIQQWKEWLVTVADKILKPIKRPKNKKKFHFRIDDDIDDIDYNHRHTLSGPNISKIQYS